MDADAIPDNPPQQIQIKLPAILRNVQVLQAIAQIVFVILVVSFFSLLWSNISATLAERNLYPSFDFLNNRAGFDIAEKPDWYAPSSSYGDAFKVGVINTLRIVSVGLVLATVIGILLGIFLLSRNWLVKTISQVYVEILRNTPLLVQLIFWYFVVMFSLPTEDITLPNVGIFILSLRVVVYPIIWLVAWFLVRRGIFPRHTAEGVLLGAIAIELAYRLFGADVPMVLVTGVVGGLLILLSLNPDISATGRGQMFGAGIVAITQVLATGVISLLVNSGVLPSTMVWWEVLPIGYISRRAWVFPEIAFTATFQSWLMVIIIGAVIGYGVYRYFYAYAERTGRLLPSGLYGLAVLVVIATIGWVIISNQPEPTEVVINDVTINVPQARETGEIGFRQEIQISSKPVLISLPERGRFRFEVGTIVSPEYLALLIGLVVYTSAFIGEIVRAGIQAVPYGQLEAARAMGLSNSQTLRLVVMPQALRLIIPPMTNQYLNLSKNSSLAIAVAFADTYQVGQTMMNQSGQSVTGFTMILLTYLSLSLLISLVMNIVNARFQLKTR
jgi:His/Glu/Gln/Arg/opine family amino acid ABC transporter permease subunit